MALLTDPSEEPITVTRAQLAYLMGAAQRWGYEARLAEENDEWLALQALPPVKVHGRWYDQAKYRAECDAQARLPRVNDYKGGPVAWNAEERAA